MHKPRHAWQRALLVLAVALLPLTLARPARADVLDDIGKKIIGLEGEADNLEKGLQAPRPSHKSGDEIERRLVEAQVAYGVGNYADASIVLYDIVENHPKSRSYREAVYYLADSLYLKGDFLTSRENFRKIVYDFGDTDTHYGRALERLLELSLKLQDDTDIVDYLARLDKIPQGARLESAPYVRGKFAYFKADWDVAIRVLDTIPKTSGYYFQARYFMGAAYIEKGELASSAKVFHALLKEPAKTKKQQRIVELSHLALGRIHYERQQASDAIEHYLNVSRRSDLFKDALYEVAYVYVQSKQFDKALRALELLEMATGGTCDKIDAEHRTADEMPEVCILKGNLSVRKGQNLTQTEGSGNSAEAYDLALRIFATTVDAYQKPRDQLEQLIKANEDPKQFFAQITKQGGEAFSTEIELPDVARRYIQAEPEVARVVVLTGDLVSIRKELEETETLLDRLERAVNSPTRVQIFPSLAKQREKATELTETSFDLRLQLGTHERALVYKYAQPEEKAELERLQQIRQDLADKLAAMPNSGDRYGNRIKKARGSYEELEKKSAEVETYITGLEAELTAIQKYYADTKDKQKLNQEVYDASIAEITSLIAALRTELDAIRKELQLAMDEAGIGDDLAREETQTRKALTAAVRAEHTYMRKILGRMSGGDATKAAQIGSLMTRLDAVDAMVDRGNRKIDKVLDAELADVRISISQEKAALAGYKRELAAYEQENEDLGSEIIYGSFQSVSKKFYEITVRADVGVIDVGWARKEEAAGDYEKIQQDAAREKRILETEMPDESEE